MRTRLAVRLAVAVIFAAFPAGAQEFKIDPSHSSANFTVRQMLVSDNVKINLQIEAVEAPPSPAERSS